VFEPLSLYVFYGYNDSNNIKQVGKVNPTRYFHNRQLVETINAKQTTVSVQLQGIIMITVTPINYDYIVKIHSNKKNISSGWFAAWKIEQYCSEGSKKGFTTSYY
jgi:hypothetical protein